jgi:hypothetical protein
MLAYEGNVLLELENQDAHDSESPHAEIGFS